MGFSRTIPLALLLSLLCACSQRGAPVKLEVASGFAFGAGPLAAISGGGLMVWGKGPAGKEFARSLDNADFVQLTLPEGAWVFYAMAWEGNLDWAGSAASGHPFGGKVRCAKSAPVAVDKGANVPVQLSLTNAGCAAPEFAGDIGVHGTGTKRLAHTRVRFCENLAEVNGLGDLCDDDLGAAGFKSRRGAVGSFRVQMRAFDGSGGQHSFVPGGITGPCVTHAPVTGDTSGHSNAVIPNLPAGGGLPAHLVVKAYLTSDCDASTGARGVSAEFHLPNGVNQPGPGGKLHQVADTPLSVRWHAFQLPDATVCATRSGVNLPDHPFAGGDGSANNPYMLCSVDQFHQLNGDLPDVLTKHYRLLKTLDFNPQSKGLGTLNIPGDASCLDHGTNFIPVGISQSCSGGEPDFGASVSGFEGRLRGRGHSLKSLRFRAEGKEYVGLFASLAAGAGVFDLKLEKPEITGGCRVGAVTGAAHQAQIARVHVVDGRITARAESPDPSYCQSRSQVGALAGFYLDSEIHYSTVLRSRVRGVAGHIGGAVGKHDQGTLNRVAVDADVLSDGPSMFDAVGGVVGYAENVALNYVKHEGAITAHDVKVGGIVGHLLGASSPLTNFYVISSVWNNNPANNGQTGGVVGHYQTSSNFGPGYALSVVRTACTGGGCGHGHVVGVASGSPTTTAYYTVTGETTDIPSPTSMVGNSVVSNYANAHNSTNMATVHAADTAGEDWQVLAGQLPRFDFEKHPCVNGLAGTGAGTALNPKVICKGQDFIDTSTLASAHYKLLGNVYLSRNSTTNGNVFDFRGILNGQGHAFIGGNSNYAGTSSTAYIGTLYNGAELNNLRVLGMERKRTAAAADATKYAAILIASNNGKITNLTMLNGYGQFVDQGAGVVGTTNSAARMENVRFTGKIKGKDALAGLVYHNQGTMDVVEFKGELACDNATCNGRAGLAYKNSSKIYRSRMAGRIMDGTGFATHYAAMLVNDASFGEIQDVHVSPHASFVLKGDSPSIFVQAVSPGTILRRIFNEGELLHAANADGAQLPAGWPVGTDPGTCTKQDNWFTGRSGKKLLDRVPYTCSDTSTLSVTAWSGINTAGTPTWLGFLAGVNFDGNTSDYASATSAEHKLFALFGEGPEGANPKLYPVVGGTFASDSLVLAAPACANGPTGGLVSVFWSNARPMDPGSLLANPTFFIPQDMGPVSALGSTWTTAGLVWDEANPDHVQAMLAHKGHQLGIPGFPAVAPATWLYEEGSPRLYQLED